MKNWKPEKCRSLMNKNKLEHCKEEWLEYVSVLTKLVKVPTLQQTLELKLAMLLGLQLRWWYWFINLARHRQKKNSLGSACRNRGTPWRQLISQLENEGCPEVKPLKLNQDLLGKDEWIKGEKQILAVQELFQMWKFCWKSKLASVVFHL